MNTTMRLLSILFVCLVQSALAQTPAYDALYLNVPLNNVHRTLPVAINDMGDVIGNVRNGEYVGEDVEIVYRGYYYNRASGTYTLAPADRIYTDINAWGQIVGGSHSLPEGPYWGLWDGPKSWISAGGIGLFWNNAGEDPWPIPPLVMDSISIPMSINDLGLIVGVSSYEHVALPLESQAVVWQSTAGGVGEPVVLPPLADYLFTIAVGISPPKANGVCTIVGQSGAAPNGEIALPVRWKVKINAQGSVNLVDGPTIIGTPTAAMDDSNSYDSCAVACNSSSFSVGVAEHQAFKALGNGNFNFLKPLKVAGQWTTNGHARAVNETKDVVGLQFTPYSNDGRPVLWPAGGSPIDLNSQVVLAAANRKLTAAVDINNLGEILALEDRPGRNSYKVRTVILMPR